MKNKFNVVLTTLLIASLAFGCKKKDNSEVSPVIDDHTGLLNNGSYIRGTVKTADENNKPMEFSFENIYQTKKMFIEPATGNGAMTIGGNYFYKAFTDMNNDYPDRTYLNFDIDSLADKTPTNGYFRISAIHGLGANNVFYFSAQDNAAVTDYKFDTISHVVSGNFAMSTTNTNNSKGATISGSFSYNDVRRVILRKASK